MNTNMNMETVRLVQPAGQRREALIAVMGPTGVGKSTFINIASNSALRVGESLMSCTDKIEHSQQFQLDDWTVTLVDTPGFDDTTKSDAEVLNIVSDYFATQYKEGRLLHGILYFHRISDNRMSGSAARNLRFFQELCGPAFLPHGIIVTTMWSLVTPATGAARETELCTKDAFFKPALAAGARMLRHDNTPASAHAILRALLAAHPTGAPLRLQQELVDERKRVAQTAAGAALLEALAAQEAAHLRELQAVEADFADAVARQDEETRAELEEARERLAAERAKLEEQKRRLVEFELAGTQNGGHEAGAGNGAAGEEAGKMLPRIPGAMPEDDLEEGGKAGDAKKTGGSTSFWARMRHALGTRRLFGFLGCFGQSDHADRK